MDVRNREFLAQHVPMGGWLLYLARGWRFPNDVAQPMDGHHGVWVCWMVMPILFDEGQ